MQIPPRVANLRLKSTAGTPTVINMGWPLVSILIPCYQAAPWIGEAIDSALAQIYPAIEVVVVDDGSHDDTLAVAESRRSARCRVFSQGHRGASAARNRALREVHGSWIQYLDADDRLAPDKLAQQMEVALKSAPRSLSFSSIGYFETEHKGAPRLFPACCSDGAMLDPAHFLAELWSGQRVPSLVGTSQWLTPRSLIEAVGPWRDDLTVDDDGEFFARVVLRCTRIVPVPEAWCFYRQHPQGGNLSSWSTRNARHRASAVEATLEKVGRLLAAANTPLAQLAARRLLTEQIVLCYPEYPSEVARIKAFLAAYGLALAQPEGSPTFERWSRCLGWRATRWLQWKAARWRDSRTRPI